MEMHLRRAKRRESIKAERTTAQRLKLPMSLKPQEMRSNRCDKATEENQLFPPLRGLCARGGELA